MAISKHDGILHLLFLLRSWVIQNHKSPQCNWCVISGFSFIFSIACTYQITPALWSEPD